MKNVLVLFALILSPLLASAEGLSDSNIVGDYYAHSDRGYPTYMFSFHADRTAELKLLVLDSATLECQGDYYFDSEKSNVLVTYLCKSGDVVTHEFTLNSISLESLQKGISLVVHIKSSSGSTDDMPISLLKVTGHFFP